MRLIKPNDHFPNPISTDADGIVGFSLNLELHQLIEAYTVGVFPWYNAGDPVIWWSTDPRMVLFCEDLKVSKSMRKVMRDEVFTFTINHCFKRVVEECGKIFRKDQDGTWITEEIITQYTKLHKMGKAISVEVWQNDELVGGLYGVQCGKVFCGESMFAKVSNASKAGFIWFVQNSDFNLIDCQIYTPHLESLGAKEISRSDFLDYLAKNK